MKIIMNKFPLSKVFCLSFVVFCFFNISILAAAEKNFYPSTYVAEPSSMTALVNGTILTGTGERINSGTVLMDAGKIVAVGKDVILPDGVKIIDAKGKWITPGIIDPHSHIGVFSSPRVPATNDLNEKTSPNTADVWVEHGVWPQAPGFERAREGGVTTMMILPGSTNLIGGRTVTLKNVSAVSVGGMKFPGAPQGLKMSCGENPIKIYGGKGRSPMTRMGVMATFRAIWLDAVKYAKSWNDYQAKIESGGKMSPPKRNLKLDTLAAVLNGDMKTHIHCYRADEMQQMIDLSNEFGFHIGVFHHAQEAYKMVEELAKEKISVATWSTRWGFKLEMYDGIEENLALLDSAGVLTSLHSDAPELSQRMNVEAAVAMAASIRAGIPVTRQQAIRWITLNPAIQLGISDRTGTLEPGKMADVVLWSGDPFSVYSITEKVFIDGSLQFDQKNKKLLPDSDFELGQLAQEAL
jgi:imidazolonepropionase-like amidohydrolase